MTMNDTLFWQDEPLTSYKQIDADPRVARRVLWDAWFSLYAPRKRQPFPWDMFPVSRTNEGINEEI